VTRASPVLDLIVEPGLAGRESLAQDRLLLADAAGGARASAGALRVYELQGDVLALGRYHLAPEPAAASVPTLLRRHTGGRAAAAGEGFLGIALTLPHRSALVAPEAPLALEPAQVMNRCVRGILAACEAAGVPALYPGRDTITAGRRLLGVVSFEVDARGALLFEAIVANARDQALLPAFLDAADPAGVVRATMVQPDDVTSIARERGAALTGYAARFGVRFTPRAFTAEERASVAQIADDALADARWLRARVPRGALGHRASTASQLGVLEAHVALAEDGTLREVVVAGDILAGSPTVDRLEGALRGAAPTVEAVEAVAARVLAEPGGFVLGLGADPARSLAEIIVRAASA
jgi:lipoate-protein ligase A